MTTISERRMLISALLAITMPVAAGAQAVPVQDPLAGQVARSHHHSGVPASRCALERRAFGGAPILTRLAERRMPHSWQRPPRNMAGAHALPFRRLCCLREPC